jgi:hypothetical protein
MGLRGLLGIKNAFGSAGPQSSLLNDSTGLLPGFFMSVASAADIGCMEDDCHKLSIRANQLVGFINFAL